MSERLTPALFPCPRVPATRQKRLHTYLWSVALKQASWPGQAATLPSTYGRSKSGQHVRHCHPVFVASSRLSTSIEVNPRKLDFYGIGFEQFSWQLHLEVAFVEWNGFLIANAYHFAEVGARVTNL
jgi:hypothetical protein